MSPKLPPEEQHWVPATIAFWATHYGTLDPDEIVAKLKTDYPQTTYRVRNGTLEALVDWEDEDE